MNYFISSIAFLTPLMVAQVGAATSTPQEPCLPGESDSTPPDGASGSDILGDYEWVEEGGDDPACIPVTDGIVWYGTWEAAMAEMERTGKPVMLHMGSVRDRTTCVPGVW